ncbi:MAG: MotE family protein [Paracoccaceae bacterium]
MPKTSALNSHSQRTGALIFIAAILLSSAILRSAFYAAPAIAKEFSAPTDHEDSLTDLSTTSPGSTITPDFAAMLTAFQEREIRIEKRERQIEDRMRALELADQAIDQKLSALKLAEDDLRSTLALARGASEGDLAQLTVVYEQMKPKDAAVLFEEMNPEFAAGFLARMKPEVAAAILAGLDPNTAYSVSVVMAGRNANVPKD